MSLLFNIIYDIKSHPFCFFTSVFLILYHIYIFTKKVNEKNYNNSYVEVICKKNRYKIVSSYIYYSNPFYLFYHLSLLWNLKILEDIYGALFIVKYTVLLMILENVILKFITKKVYDIYIASSSISYSITLANINVFFLNFNTTGIGSILFAWIAFLSIVMEDNNASNVINSNNPSTFLFLGFIEISYFFAPFLLLFITLFIQPRKYILVYLISLLCGTLLTYNYFQFLDNNYWSLILFFNVIFYILNPIIFNLNDSSENEELVSVISSINKEKLFNCYSRNNEQIIKFNPHSAIAIEHSTSNNTLNSHNLSSPSLLSSIRNQFQNTSSERRGDEEELPLLSQGVELNRRGIISEHDDNA